MISKLTHELKHIFDKIKNTTSKIGKNADYYAFSSNEISIKPLNDFIYAIYFTTDIESSVRNSELYSNLKLNKVKKTIL